MSQIERPCSVFATHPDGSTWRVYDDLMTEDAAKRQAAYMNAHGVSHGTIYEARGYYWKAAAGRTLAEKARR